MGKRFIYVFLFISAALLLRPGSARGQSFNPMTYNRVNYGSRNYPVYSGYSSYSPYYVPLTTSIPVYPPSVNYPAFYSPFYQPAYRASPPSINYPLFYHQADLPNTATPAVSNPLLVNAAPQAAYQTGTPLTSFTAAPAASDWMETMQLAAAPAEGRQLAVNSPAARGPAPTAARRPTTTVWIDVYLPADAEVWFEGVRTRQTGPLRRFQSPPITAGKEFTYTCRAVWIEKGKKVERQEDLRVSAGDWWRVELGATSSQVIALTRTP